MEGKGSEGPLARLRILKEEINAKKEAEAASRIEQESELPSQTVSNIDLYDESG